MLKSKIHIILIAVLLSSGAVRSFAQTVPPKADEGKLIAVLKSADASHKEKADACRGLALIGTGKSVATLASLLGNEELSHMARYALEPIPDPAVDQAFRDALGKLKGKPLVGVIGSIGVRRDAQAVGALTTMLRASDAEVTHAAARALGNIGNSAAVTALQRQLANASSADKLHICEGLFRCAETLSAGGQKQEAVGIYDQLRKLDDPHQIRAGALRGAILARGKDGVALLQENLRNGDYIMFSTACQTAMELPGGEVTKALTAELDRLPADNQILIIRTLGRRGDDAAMPALFAKANSGAKSVRIEAIRAMPEIGSPTAVPILAALLNDGDSDICQGAQEALAAIPGREADAAVMAMLNSNEAGQRLTALELIGRRRMTASIPALLKAAAEADPKVSPTALKRVGELGGPSELPALLDILMELKASADISAAEQALIAMCTKTDGAAAGTERLTALLSQAQPAQKSALLRVLGAIGGTNALNAVRAATDDSNEQVRDAAIRALAGWKTADAAPDLLRLAKTASNESQKTAALRGYISLVRDENMAVNARLQMCRQAAELIQRNQEKMLLLGVLGTVPSADALAMAMSHLDDPATKDAASFAAVAISEKIAEQKPNEVAEALQKVLKATSNRDVTRRARAVLKNRSGR
ncbi:MAG: HEAT repeat domain-containing protein [Planctomycetota bacterium]